LVAAFAAAHQLTLNEVNLEKHPELEGVFRSLDTGKILRELEALLGRDPRAPGGLLFLDEIQAAPAALQALRYFHEGRPELPVVAAGSLLDFALAAGPASMPVGRIEYRHLYPLTFEEFVAAMGKERLRESLRRFSPLKPETAPAETAHAELRDLQRLFLFIGGMPEAVSAYVQRGSVAEAAQIQRSLLAAYRDDFAKYATRKELARLQWVFDKTPLWVGRKVKYAAISREEPAREIRSALRLLAKARLICPVHHSSASGLPLAAQADPDAYKLAFLDVGLMNRLLGLDWLAVSRLDDRGLVNEGPLAEQFAAQELLSGFSEEGREDARLFYWLREGRVSNAEVDYVVSRGDWIVPVEVKAGSAGALKSLHQFAAEKGSRLAVRLDLRAPSFHVVRAVARLGAALSPVEYRLLSLPLYLAGQLPRILDELRAELGP
jgi:predicted AAA+ superfamily ATPase